MFVILVLLTLSPKADSLLIEAIELSYQEEFERSESLLNIIISDNPHHPAPYFGLASLYELMWVDTGNDSIINTFLSYSDSSIFYASNWIKKHPDDSWGYFFLGGSYILRIFYHELRGEIFKGLPFIGPALKWLSKCRSNDPNIYDVYLGLGVWEYFKGHFPFFSAKKDKGLSMIKRASDRARYVNLYASFTRAEIYLKERDYDEAISILKPLVDSYPNSRTLTWPLLKAYFEKKDYEKSLIIANNLINISRDNIYSYFYAVYYKTKILLGLRMLKGARESCLEALELDINPDAPHVKETKKELNKILKDLNQRMGIDL
jgi:tetratricopeptide (TPR) repeat protein